MMVVVVPAVHLPEDETKGGNVYEDAHDSDNGFSRCGHFPKSE